MGREIVLLIVLLLVLGGLLYFSRSFHVVSEQDAKKFFLENLAQNYPNSDIRQIVDVVQLGNDNLRLKAQVTTGIKTPCPERLHVYYNYPSKNFVYEVETITSGCVVCHDTPNCQILWPEEAIIASHKYSGGAQVEKYIKSNDAATPTTEFLQNYGDYEGVWKVTWDAPNASSSISAFLSQQQNKILDVVENQKQ